MGEDERGGIKRTQKKIQTKIQQTFYEDFLKIKIGKITEIHIIILLTNICHGNGIAFFPRWCIRLRVGHFSRSASHKLHMECNDKRYNDSKNSFLV